jgi:pilus assembly protein FimV
MILTCQKCSTSFNLDETLLKATGSKVRCSLCQNIWVAFPPETSAKGRLELDDDGPGTGAAGLAAAGVSLGSVSAGLVEDGVQETEQPEAVPPELKFFADEEIEETPSEDDDLVTDEINLDELDQLLSEDESSPSHPSLDEDFKTEELNLADLEKMLELESEQSGEGKWEEAADSEELDFGDALPDDSEIGETDKEDSVIEELDLDLEDLEHLLEEDTGLGDEIAAVEETAGGIGQEAAPVADEINLDMDSDLEDLLEDDSREPMIEETEEIGVSEFSDAPKTASPTAGDAGEDQGLDFELAPGLDGIFDEDEEDEAQDVPIEETEELDFSEFEANFAPSGDELAQEEQELELDLESATPEGRSEDMDDLGDLALSLEEDAATEQPSDEEALPELDLSDLDQALDDSAVKAAGAVEEAEASEQQLEMDFDVTGGKDEAEELDLFLEDDMLSDNEESAGSTGDIPEETRELEVDELESLLEGAEDGSGAEEEPPSDSLELDIDLDSLEEGGDDDMDDATRELDLNDIEKILEMEGTGEDAGGDAPPSEDLDLDLDLDMDSVAPPAEEVEETGEDTTDADAALDLSELEKMLDVEDTTDSPAVANEDMDDLDLDFELQPSTEESEDLDLEFDMLDEEPAQASALFDTSESEDLGLDLEGSGGGEADADDLDFEIMDEDLAVEEVDLDLDAEDISADTLSEPIAVAAAGKSGRPHNRDLTQELMDEMAAADTQTMATPPMETKPIKPAPPIRRKKKSSKSLVLILILILLGGAGYLLPKYTDIKLPEIKLPDLSGIPFIGQYFGSPSNQAILPVESSLKGDWVQNQQAGRLYIIQGRVKNEYSSPRSYIRVTGRVYANGRKFQRAAKGYCGNIIPADELATLPLADIQQKLNNRMGLDNTNVNVAPGQEIPFMIVFGDLPPDVELQEFAVEISGSLPVAAK